MASIFDRLVEYNAKSRTLDTRQILDGRVIIEDLNGVIEDLKQLSQTVFQGDEEALCREIGEWSRFRALFVLLPEQLLFGDAPIEEKPLITAHLEVLGVDATPSLVNAIKYVCINFRAKRSGVRKYGINDVYVKFPHIYKRILSQQGNRCCYCGIPVKIGENAELDHVWPFHLGDDPLDGSNWSICCGECNNGKGEYPFYSLTMVGVNWIGPNDKGSLTLRARFAALIRDRGCVTCGVNPTEAALQIRKRFNSGCWILDNIVSVCDQHDADASSVT